MKAFQLLMLSFLLIGSMNHPLNAQTIINPDFEQTDTLNGFAFISDWEGDGFGGAPSTVSQSGNYSMMIWNWYWYGRAYAYNGSNPSLGFGSAYKGGTPYTQKALKLNGYYRYDTSYTQTEDDSAVVAVLLKKYNSTLQKVDTIGFGEVHLPSYSPGDNSFAPFEVNIQDWQPGIQPDSIVVYMQSSISGFCGMATNGECLYFNVDNLSLETPLGITDIQGNKIAPKIFPNPSNGNFTIDFPQGEMESIKIYSIDGKLINKFSANGMRKMDVSLSGLYPGIYVAEIKTVNGVVMTERMVVE